MSNLSYPGSPSLSVSPRMPQEQKWTVSPEFGDALLAAMRERTESGGSIPRLPSLLQLPGSDTVTSPVTVSEVSLDNTKLTMKTRVAVRDKTPHRFQVVPLREIRSFAFPPQDSVKFSKATRGTPCAVKLNIQDSTKTHTLNANENSVPATTQIQEQKLALVSEQLEKGQTLGNVNQFLPDLKNSCISVRPTSPIMLSLPKEQRVSAHRTPLPPVLEKVQPQLITTHRSTMPTRSILRSRNTKDHDHSHAKSPSLGNLYEKPPLSREHNFATLPRVGCRKRTNTLSVDDSTLLRGDLVIYEETKILERRRPLEHNALKRHAIYTQSLYVPHDERRFSPGMIPLKIESGGLPFPDARGDANDMNPRQRRVSGISLQSNNSFVRPSQQAISLYGNYTTLDLSDAPHIPRPFLPSSSFTQGISSESQSSISSIYSQDGLSLSSHSSQATLTQIRPLTQSRLSSDYQLIVRRRASEHTGKGMIVHHPIIVKLFAEVDKAMKDWQNI